MKLKAKTRKRPIFLHKTSQLEQNLAAQIRRAQHQGEAVNQDDAMKLARFLAMGIYGMRTMRLHSQMKPC